jgi:hypothetical protein
VSHNDKAWWYIIILSVPDGLRVTTKERLLPKESGSPFPFSNGKKTSDSLAFIYSLMVDASLWSAS